MPSELVEILGDPSRRGVPENEPRPQGAPVKPDYLEGRASSVWDRKVAVSPWVKAPDADTLGLWCRYQAEIETNPNVLAWKVKEWRTMGSLLGFDPSSRSRIKTQGGELPGDDLAADYLREFQSGKPVC